jgi:hypothetical protein
MVDKDVVDKDGTDSFSTRIKPQTNRVAAQCRWKGILNNDIVDEYVACHILKEQARLGRPTSPRSLDDDGWLVWVLGRNAYRHSYDSCRR